jgi:hypothetical protein
VDRKTLLLSQEVKSTVSPNKRFQVDTTNNIVNESLQHNFNQRLTFGSSLQQSQVRQSPGIELPPNEYSINYGGNMKTNDLTYTQTMQHN